MDSTHWALSFPLSLCLSLYFPSMHQTASGDWSMPLVILLHWGERVDPLATWVENSLRKTLLTLLGCMPTPLNQLLWPVLPKQAKQTRPVRELWVGIRPGLAHGAESEQLHNWIFQTVSLTASPSLGLQDPTEFLSSSQLPVHFGSRLGKD